MHLYMGACLPHTIYTGGYVSYTISQGGYDYMDMEHNFLFLLTGKFFQ